MTTQHSTQLKVFPVPQHAAVLSEPHTVSCLHLTHIEKDSWCEAVIRQGTEKLGIAVHDTEQCPDRANLMMTQNPETIAALSAKWSNLFETEIGIDAEGYILSVTREGDVTNIVIASPGGAGLAYGADTLMQILFSGDTPAIPELLILDYPAVGMRVYGGAGTDEHAASLRFNIRRKSGTPEENTRMKWLHIDPMAGLHPSHADAGKPGLMYSDQEAVTEVLTPLVEAARNGAKWLMISFDDIDLRLAHPSDIETYGTLGKAHAAFANEALRQVQNANPDARLVLIPIIYASNWLAGTWVYATDEDAIYDYLTTVAREVDPSVVFVWTGESVESISMTDDDIEQWVDLTGRKPLVFENTPTGDPDDLGAFKMRTTRIGELLGGWIYIHRGPKAAVAEYTTAEFLWNPQAYDPDAALTRAVKRIASEEAAPHLERLVRAFSRKPEGFDPRYFNPIWREGRMLEAVDPDNGELADYYVERLQTISEVLPKLDGLMPEDPFYQIIRQIALSSVDVYQAYLETFVFIKSIEAGDMTAALRAGDQAETLYQEWRRFSTGPTNLTADTDRRDAMTYIEQVDVPGKLRALRRGGEQPVRWVILASDSEREMRFGRQSINVGEGQNALRFTVHSLGKDEYLVLTGCGASGSTVKVEAGGEQLDVDNSMWSDERWVSIPVRLPDGKERFEIVISALPEYTWALARVAAVQIAEPSQLLHATRSACSLGERTSMETPRREIAPVVLPWVNGQLAVRTDLELVRGASGSFYDLTEGTRIGQTFHIPEPSSEKAAPKDHIHLTVRESSDGDFLHGFGVMFPRQGTTPLQLTLWRWAGSVEKTLSDPGNRITEAKGRAGTPYGGSRHWMFFRLDVELDFNTTYYAELTAPEGWEGWRLRRAFGWYGHRGDPTRSVFLNGEIEKSVDIPFRTYVLDVYDATWK